MTQQPAPAVCQNYLASSGVAHPYPQESDGTSGVKRNLTKTVLFTSVLTLGCRHLKLFK